MHINKLFFLFSITVFTNNCFSEVLDAKLSLENKPTDAVGLIKDQNSEEKDGELISETFDQGFEGYQLTHEQCLLIEFDENKTALIINQAAQKHAVDPDLIRAIIKIESNNNHCAISPAGAKGLMQLMDPTAIELGVTNPFDPAQNIYAGTRYFATLKNKYDLLQYALGAYNAGESRIKKFRRPPPFKETQKYIRSVLNEYNRLKRSN